MDSALALGRSSKKSQHYEKLIVVNKWWEVKESPQVFSNAPKV